jgi:2,3-bisphosphoglycerate-dependent phosphoglycerate mutase
MSKLVLVRHGQSQWNLENRFTGWVDVPITPLGAEEAHRAGKLLGGLRFDVAFTSALKRAQQTLEIILEELGQKGLPVVRDAAINERHYGDLQGLNKAETAKKFGDAQVHVWRRSYDVAPPGGESLKDTAARTLPFFQARILPEVKAGKNVLVVAHGNSLRAIVMDLDGLSKEQVMALNIDTCKPITYEIDPSGKILEKTAA